ncbi:pre-mRNA-processing protein 40A isoform X3 [Ipomoea triloba]|uniref:pre-mRNA-processing protein 40A isoform X3 n=1 Tax=Ipomoea triloba TaxID=35885 RepID=UPI00125D4746|nr:pre-mRNA-processing protein 40A isoform X3 [Ipomoea triloba]
MAANPPPSGAQPLRPHPGGPMAPHGYGSFPMQFQPGAPAQQGQPFAPPVQMPNIGMGPGQSQAMQFSQPMQQFPPRPGQPGHIPSSQPIQMASMQPNMPIPSASMQPQQMIPSGNNHMPGFAASSFGQTNSGINMSSQIGTPAFTAGGQPWVPPANQSAPMQHTSQQPSAFAPAVVNNAEQSTSDWQEYEVSGRRYYYNKITKQSSWEKPLELMTPLERAEALTGWKEFTTENGRKYYYHKEKKESKWEIPEELKLAREQAEKAAAPGPQGDAGLTSKVAIGAAGTSTEQQFTAVTPVSSSPSTISGVPSSSAPVTPAVSVVNAPSTVVSGSSANSATLHPVITSSISVSSPAATLGSNADPASLASSNQAPTNGVENSSPQVVASSGVSSIQDIEQMKKSTATNIHVTVSDEKAADEEPLVYATKQEAKNAFKALLESANVGSDWTWDQTVRAIANDKRYGALKIHGERKQAFNEYLMQRKKLEAEERRLRQRKAKEEFTKMLEESKELTSSTRWSKAVTMFEDDERFKAVEREADREDLFRNYLVDLQKKEKAKAQEDYRKNRLEYRQFLETCGFIKVDTQWRKVQDLLEDDERCSRLEKIDRLEVFQEYIRDLEKEEEEQRKTQKEQLRRAERKNRDAFRNMMADHIAAGTVTAKTLWRDYCPMVKESVAYQAVASNTSGSTPKDLFEDVVEELENQYHEDKTRVKNVLKSEKITFSPLWSFEDFKAAILETIGTPSISEVNLQLIFEDLMERAKDKEEKEAKKRQRLAKDFVEMLSIVDEITAASSWEECKELVEDSSEYKAIGDETTLREIFEEYVTRLQEKAKEKERRREEEKVKKDKEKEEKEKRKDKERKEKDKEKEEQREREKEKGKERSRKDDADSESVDFVEYEHKEDKKRDKDKDRKHRKRHHSSTDDVTSDKDEKEETKKSRRHSGERKKSKKHAHSPESDGESRRKRHKKERDASRRSGGYEELEDGELGEDGEIQ